jgi:hypothetical protein|tara:strand:- start:1614 stop:2792 length:1179 start_codon:yes stop_codon:yes gene_type:complete
MIAKNIFIFFLVSILVTSISYSFQANSSNYKLSTGIVSSGGEIVNSSSYKSYVATGIIGGVINSSTYKNLLGFFYTWLLGDDQPCTANSQCDGGYCCSNLCKSSTCPTEGEGEAAATAAGDGGAAAGGGGGGIISIKEEKDYSVSQSNVKVKLTLGESAEEILKISNTGQTLLSVSLDVEGINEYMSLSDNVVEIDVDEYIEVTLDFIGKTVGTFVGRIMTTADEIKKIIPIIFEVVTELVLFDVKLDIPAAYAEVEQGDELKTQITLLNVGAPEKVDVFVTYFIKDLRGNIVYEETETFAVEKQISYSKSFKIHDSQEPGNYVAVIEVRYADSFAVSSQLFRVVEKKAIIMGDIITKNTTIMLFLVFILGGVLSLLIYKLSSIGKKRKKQK